MVVFSERMLPEVMQPFSDALQRSEFHHRCRGSGSGRIGRRLQLGLVRN